VAVDIIISKKDEVYAHINCEKHIKKELHEHFSFMVPGHQFVPAFRNKTWNGKIYLYHLNTSQIYLGLLTHIEEFCKSNEYSIEYKDNLDFEDEFSLYHAKKFAESLNIHSNNKKIDINDHQYSVFVHTMQHKRALFVSPTASGKSLIAYMIFIQLHVYKRLKGFMIVPNTSLVEQMTTDFEDYSSHNNFNVSDNVNKIYDFKGMVKQTDKSLTISTWQSIFKEPKEFFEQFDYVIGDESHLFTSQSLIVIMTSCVNAKYRIGMTGTLSGAKTNKLVLEGLFGKSKQFVTTRELMDKGIVSKLEIKCLILKHPEENCKELREYSRNKDTKDRSYRNEIEYIVNYEPRNKFIKNLAVSMNTNTLILYDLVEKHGKILYELIKNTEKIGNRKVFFIHGNVKTEEREAIRKQVELEKDAIVIASYKTFSTGNNIKNLHNIIFASPSKGRIKNLQSIGRGLRLHESKSVAILYDISDDMRYNKYINHTLKHFVERTRIYTEEKLPFKIYKIGLKNG
jgi:superfamily II DNA or RNA helicase